MVLSLWWDQLMEMQRSGSRRVLQTAFLKLHLLN